MLDGRLAPLRLAELRPPILRPVAVHDRPEVRAALELALERVDQLPGLCARVADPERLQARVLIDGEREVARVQLFHALWMQEHDLRALASVELGPFVDRLEDRCVEFQHDVGRVLVDRDSEVLQVREVEVIGRRRGRI